MTQLAETRRPTTPRTDHEAVRRAIDIAASLALIVILAPLFLILFLFVRSTSRGPALFRQERLGISKQPFALLKLRTMYADNDDRIHREYVTSMLTGDGAPAVAENGLYKLEDDPRITRLGVWLRRTSLDELPQLFNVLRGEMSLVGPRPMLPWEAELLGERHQRRFKVKPGITGLWQVSGRSRLSMRKALDLDVEYVVRRSLILDCAILARTVPTIFRGGAM